MNSSGSAYGRFRRALDTGNLLAVRAVATECQHVGLAEALELTFRILAKEPTRFRALRSAGTLATAATTVDQKTPMATPPATTTAMTVGTDTGNAPPLQRHCAIKKR